MFFIFIYLILAPAFFPRTLSQQRQRMKIAEIIGQALEQRGMGRVTNASQELGISQELLRITLFNGHIPKDSTLSVIADGLGLDKYALIMAAHRERISEDLKGLILFPVPRSDRKRRIRPLSEEQCDHLAMILSPEELQIVRKFRQVPDEEQAQIIDFIDYLFASKRESPAIHAGAR